MKKTPPQRNAAVKAGPKKRAAAPSRAPRQPPAPKVIAVTGASGSLGEAVIDQLLDAFPRTRIIALDIASPHRRRDPERVQFVCCDVRDRDLAAQLAGVDAVIHLAFIVEKTGGLTPQQIESINLGGTRNVFMAAAAAGVKRFVYASSVAAYGMHPERSKTLLTEDMPLRGNPDFFYAHHKAEVERWLDQFEKKHPEIRIARLRPCIFLGERSATRPVRLLAYTPVIPSLGGYEHVRFQLAHEDDVAAAFVLALAKRAHGAFNLAAEGTVGLRQAASEMGKWSLRLPGSVLKLSALVYRLGLSPFDPDWLIKAARANVIMATGKAQRELGWKPRHPTAGDVLRAVAQAGGQRR